MTEISRSFVAARRFAVAMDRYPGPLPDSLPDAYDIQHAAIASWPDDVAGWKVAGVTDVRQAVIRMGNKLVQSSVVSFALRQAQRNEVLSEESRTVLRELWEESVARFDFPQQRQLAACHESCDLVREILADTGQLREVLPGPDEIRHAAGMHTNRPRGVAIGANPKRVGVLEFQQVGKPVENTGYFTIVNRHRDVPGGPQ